MAEEIEVRVRIDSKPAEKSLDTIGKKVEDVGKKTNTFGKQQEGLGKELLGNSKVTDGLSKATGGMSDAFLKATKGVKLTNLSLKGMKTAIMSTGVGLLVIAVGELVSMLADFYDSEKQSEKAVNDLNDALDEQEDAFDRTRSKAKFYYQLASKESKLNGATQEELFKQTQEFHKEEIKALQEKIVKNLELAAAISKNDKLTAKAKKEQFDKMLVLDKKYQEQQEEVRRNLRLEEADYNIEVKSEQDRANKEKLDKEKANSEKISQQRKAEQDKIKSLELKYKLDIENLEDDTDQKKLDRQKLRAEQELNQLKTTSQQKLALQKQIDEDFILRQKQLDDKIAEEKKKKDEEDAKIELEKKQKAREEKLLGIELEMEEDNISYESKKELLRQREAVLLQDNELTSNQRIQIERETTEAIKELDTLQYENKVALLKGTSDALAMASDVIGKETAVGKGLAVASALMNTYQGISAGVKLGYPQAIPAVAMASLTGFGAVKNILGVKVPKQSSSASVGSSSMTTPPQISPNFNVVGDTGINQIAQTLGRQAPVQAYVVANNVTTAQSMNRSIIQNASLG